MDMSNGEKCKRGQSKRGMAHGSEVHQLNMEVAGSMESEKSKCTANSPSKREEDRACVLWDRACPLTEETLWLPRRLCFRQSHPSPYGMCTSYYR